jgi:hypothetical protein
MRFLLLSILFFWASITFGQGISGMITDTNGLPLPYTNIFVPELKKGTTSNAEGNYFLPLPQGNWKIEFRNIGYTTHEQYVETGEQDIRMDVAMDERKYRIGEIKVLASGEDPAMYVMRRAIAMAPYYKNQVSEYNSMVYLKGSGKFGRIPRMLRKTLEKQGVKANDVYSVESLSKIEFSLPDELKQQVIAQRTSGNDNNTSPMPMVTSNLYNASKYGVISPFDRQALQVYRFRLAGMFEDQGRMINRIEVVPRRKGNDVFEGIINVADGYWSVHSADLKLTAPMMEIRMKQLYGPVDINTWMPVSLSFDIIFSGMGFEFDYIYVASVSDYQVKLNPRLDHSFIEKQRMFFAEEERIGQNFDVVAHPGSLPEETRPSGRIENLLKKEELTTREAKQLNRLLEKETTTTSPPPLEIEQRIFMDSVKVERDSAFWTSIRPIPLTLPEASGFLRKDSLNRVQSTPEWRDSVEIARRRFKPVHILRGSTYSYHPRGSAARNTVSVPGIATGNLLSFNTVDGLKLSLPFRWNKSDTLGHAFSLSPELSYGFARKKTDASLAMVYTWDGARRATFGLSGGTTTADFNQESGMSVFSNDFHTLWYERNYKKLFRRDFAEIFQRIEISNGLNLEAKAVWADRQPLVNYSEYRIIDWKNRSYTDNIPLNAKIHEEHTAGSRSLEWSLSLNWTPRQRYYFRNGFKYYASGRSPVFSLAYRKATPLVQDRDADYDYVEAGIRQRFTIGIGNIFEYKASAGAFLNNQRMHFSDFRHFATHYPWLYTGPELTSFALNPFYSASTDAWFAEGHASWESGRILVKRLPFLANSIVTEQLFVHLLHNDHFRYYTEAGYGIRNIFAVFSLEAVAAFKSGRFSSAGLKLGLNLPGM